MAKNLMRILAEEKDRIRVRIESSTLGFTRQHSYWLTKKNYDVIAKGKPDKDGRFEYNSDKFLKVLKKEAPDYKPKPKSSATSAEEAAINALGSALVDDDDRATYATA